MALTDTACRQAKPAEKPYKLADSGGLYLLINQAGKYWRWDYRHLGKRKTLALGVYPDTSLSQARERHQAARKVLAEGIDPSEQKKADKRGAQLAAANSFEAVARAWLDKYKQDVTESTHGHAKSRMEREVFPWLGKRLIAEIDAPEILTVLKRMDARGVRFSAHKSRSEISRVFRYGITEGFCKSDPARDLVGAIPTAKTKHFAAITDPVEAGELLRSMDGYSGSFITRCALKLAPMLFCRPGELRQAEWAHVDLDGAAWRFYINKTDTAHLVPLSRQALEVLRELHALTGAGRYVFPGARSHQRPMSENTINGALRALGWDTQKDHTGHGFRAMARTILHEELGQDPAVIEHQLAHKVPDTLGTAYNRTKFIKQRRAMMQAWADYLDVLRVGGNVIPLTRTA